MTQLISIIVSTVFLSITFISCVDVPVRYTLSTKFKISKKDIKDANEKIFQALSGLDVGEENCKRDYKIWLKTQFELGYLPKKVIKPSDYAPSIRDPSKCKDLDLAIKFEITSKKIFGNFKTWVFIYPLKESRDALPPYKCVSNFIDPAKEKLRVAAIDMNVTQNTLNISSFGYVIYTSNKISKETIKKNTEEKLLQDGIIKKLTETKSIPAKFVGTWPIDISSSKDFTPLVSLEGFIVIYPTIYSFNPETIKKDDGQIYYVIPEGSLSASAQITYTVSGDIFDAKCFYDEYIDKIKEEERKRQGR